MGLMVDPFGSKASALFPVILKESFLCPETRVLYGNYTPLTIPTVTSRYHPCSHLSGLTHITHTSSLEVVFYGHEETHVRLSRGSWSEWVLWVATWSQTIAGGPTALRHGQC